MAVEDTKPELTYTGVRVHSATVVIVSCVADELAEDKIDHAIVFTWSSGRWSKKPIPYAVVAVCSAAVHSPQLFSVCATGEVVVASSAGFSEEKVDPSDDGPSHLAPLRTASVIGGQVYAAGMARRMYCRTGPNRWQAIDRGVFVPRTQRKEAVGFLSLDGLGPTDIFAAGYKGEIWHYDGKAWTRQESPTNVALTSVRCGPEGCVCIAGLAGALIRGRAGAWEAIQHEVTTDDFWGGAIFKGVPYFATNRAIYRLFDGTLEQVDLSALGTITTGHLDCDSEVMWSAGSKHLAATRDGMNWEIMPGPT